MVETAPSPLDIQDFQFKLHCKLRIFSENYNVISRNVNLITAASKFGLIFVACPNNTVQVIQSKSISNITSKGGEVEDYPRRTISLPSNALYIAVNCDNTLLAIIVIKDSCPVSFIYDVASFFSPDIQIINEIRLSSTQLVSVVDICWNPVIKCIFSVCLSDGCAHVFEIKTSGVEINSLEPSSQSTCMCWSPKGKQVVIGSKNGIISQYKPDLKLVKTYPAPPLGNVSVISIVWISNYQFAAIFQNTDDCTSRPSLCIVNVPKNEPVNYINFDDICYSSGDFRLHQFYLLYQPAWSVILSASANSMEIGVLGASHKEGVGIWQQWLQSDDARAELPLSSSKQETYPIGLSFDTSSTHELSWGENKTLPPMPLLYLLSYEGVLCVFNVINTRPEAPAICSPPQEINNQKDNMFYILDASKDLETNVKNEINQQLILSSNSINTLIPNKNSMNLQPSLEEIQASTVNEQQEYKFQINNFINNVEIINPKQSIFSSVQSSQSSSGIPSSSISINCKKDNSYSDNQKSLSNIVEKQPQFDNSLIINLIKEVIIQFQVELTALQNKWYSVDINVGNEEENCILALQSETLQLFFSELQDTTITQRAEIYALKKILIEGFALQEEVVSRFRHVTNPYFVKVFPTQDLDPISSKQISDIKHFLYYIDSQLKQVNDYLDNEWSEFQDSCKNSIKEKLRIPTLEAVYQTMVKHYEILMRQNYIMKDIRTRIKICNKKKGHLPLLSNVSMENIKSNDLGLLELSMNKLHVTVQPEDIFKKKFELIEGNQKKITMNKEKKLRSLFTSNSKLIRISPKKPSRNCLSNSVLLVTPAKLNKLPLAKPGGITSGTPIKICTDEIKIKQQSGYLINSENVRLTKSHLSKKISEYYEDITPPQTPNVMKLESKNESNHGESNNVWNDKEIINDTIFKTNLMQNPKSSDFFCSTANNQFFKGTFTPTNTFSKNVPTSVNYISSTQIKSGTLKKNETLCTSTELSSLSFGTKKTCEISDNTNDFESTKVNNSKIEDNLMQSKSVIDTKNISKSPFSGFGITSNSNLNSLPKLSNITSKPTQVINAAVINQNESCLISNVESPRNSLISTLTSKSLLADTNSTCNIITHIDGQEKNLSMDKLIDQEGNMLKDTKSHTLVTSTNYLPVFPTSQTILNPEASKSFTHEIISSSTNTICNVTTPLKSSGVPTLNSNVSTESSLNIGNLLDSLEETEVSTVISSSGPFNFTSPSTNTSTDSSNKLNFGQNLYINKPSVTSVNTFIGKPICTATFNQNNSKVISSVFGPPLTTTSANNIFGQLSTTNNTVTQNLTDKNNSTSEKASTGPLFKQNSLSASGSIFATSPVTTTISLFNQTSKPSESPSGSIFNLNTSVAPESIFDQVTSGVAFGQSVTTTSITTGTIFKQTLPTSSSVFGQAVISTTTAGSIFGQPVTTFTTGSLFGQSVTSSVTTGSVFDQSVTSTSATTGPVFGQSVTSTSATTGSVFGQSVVSSSITTGSVFGQVVNSVNTTSGSIFGQSLGTPTTVTGSIFSQKPSTSNNFTEIFGQTSTKVTGSIFGQPASAGNSMTIFGQTQTNSNSSLFGQPVTTTNTSTNIFGQPITTSLGVSGTIFGQPTTSNANDNIFGQPSTSTSIFGSSSTNNSSPGTIFGKPTTTTVSTFIQQSNENIFGSKSIFGQQPVFGQNTFGSNNTPGNIFGSTTTFGSNTSIFGSSNNNTFGSTTVQSPNTSTFSGSGQSVNQVGFGSSTVFQKSPTAFGAAPSFGSPPSFGASPVFGGSPAFGSPQKVFGSPQATNTFGTSAQQNSTFANIANQNTVGFGNLAQNQNIAQPQNNSTQFSGGSFSNWR